MLTNLSVQHNKASIIFDASKYIEELKQNAERLDQDNIATAESSSTGRNLLPEV